MSTTEQPDLTGSALNAQRFQMLEDIAKELSGEVIFPTCFDAATRIRKALRDVDQPLDRIITQISMEPMIGAKLLSLANSVAYNQNGIEVKDLKGAINRLGLEIVRSTAMAITMNQMLRSRDLVGFDSIAQGLWQHTLHTASATYVLAKRMTRFNPDEAMLAGLVHDMGAFYMLYRATQYSELRARPDTVKFLIAQWHDSIGVSVLASLGMPDEIIEAVRDHDVPRPAPAVPKTMADVVYLGNLLAGGIFEWTHDDSDREEIECFLPGESYSALLEEIEEHRSEMTTVFS